MVAVGARLAATPGSAGRARSLPRPFVRWVGGKRWAAPLLLPLLPPAFGRYHEPFLGGGAIALALARAGRLGPGAALGDANAELVGAWGAVRDDDAAVAAALGDLHAAHDRDAFLRVMRADPPLDPAARAARFIYLTNGGYDGAWRIGRDGRPTIHPSRKPLPPVDPENLAACAAALAGCALRAADVRDALAAVEPGDLVVLDPPYHDEAGVETHRYDVAGWGDREQRDLLARARRLRDCGTFVVLFQPEIARDALPGWTVVVAPSHAGRREAMLLGWDPASLVG